MSLSAARRHSSTSSGLVSKAILSLPCRWLVSSASLSVRTRANCWVWVVNIFALRSFVRNFDALSRKVTGGSIFTNRLGLRRKGRSGGSALSSREEKRDHLDGHSEVSTGAS